jgi:hypothetical protein
MSRGPGKHQRSILEAVAASPEPTTYETLRWKLFEQEKGRLTEGKLPATWYTALDRSLKALGDQGERRVVVKRRRLTSVDEFIRNYPNKTLMARTRKLRIDLLPALVRCIQSDKFSKNYTIADNETFHASDLPDGDLGRLRRNWSTLKPELVAHLPRLGEEDGEHLFLLIARAKSIFESPALECKRSIDQCLQPLVEHGALPKELEEKVVAFSESFLPKAEIDFLRLKSSIRTVVDISRNGSGYRLKPDTLDFLDDDSHDVVRKIPGYKPPPEGRARRSFLCCGPKATHGPEIHKLVDQTMFQEFVFVQKP